MPDVSPVTSFSAARKPPAASSGRHAQIMAGRAPAAAAPAGPSPAPRGDAGPAGNSLRFFFFSDTHAGFALTEKFVTLANRERPDLLIDGGDIVEEGTQPEFDRAHADRAYLAGELRMVTGNHDVLRRGPFTSEPPTIPAFQSFDRQGVHFILLDNENEEISDELFAKLEADLEANKGKTTIVAMHVPPVLTREHGFVKLRKLVPFGTATPSMKVPAQVERFKGLMKKYQVSAVLAGHTHAPSETTIDGTRYIVAGAVGGKTPGPGIAHEYLDIRVRGRDVDVRRVALDRPPSNLISHAFAIGGYIARKNAHNHSALGWDEYVPGTGAEVRTGLRRTNTERGTSHAVAVTGEIETMMDDPRGRHAAFVEGTAAIGSREASLDLAVGYKRRLVGDFNRNLYFSGAAVVNAGVVIDRPTAGIGARAAIGSEYKNWTFQLSHERSTNRDATMLSVGYRF